MDGWMDDGTTSSTLQTSSSVVCLIVRLDEVRDNQSLLSTTLYRRGHNIVTYRIFEYILYCIQAAAELSFVLSLL